MGDEQAGSAGTVSRRDALKKGAVVGGAVVWAVPVVQSIGMTPALAQTPTPVVPCPGRMTGGGRIAADNGNTVAHGFNLRCGVTGQVDGGPGNHLTIVEHEDGPGTEIFKLDFLTVADCTNDPTFSEGNPVAGFDTFHGVGTGRFNPAGPGGFEQNYSIDFVFTDKGEPGSSDTATITITDPGGNVVLQVTNATLTPGGNHQAHPGHHTASCD